MKITEKIYKLVLAALFFAMGFVLPYLTGLVKEIGDTLLPMHLPIMLCGIICGARYGFATGLLLPFARALTGMPPFYPNAVWMALELATYGFVIGLLYSRVKKHNAVYLLICLICSMIAGRIVWGAAKAILLTGTKKAFTINAFIMGGFVDALPGIIIQLVLIPIIVEVYEREKRRRKR